MNMILVLTAKTSKRPACVRVLSIAVDNLDQKEEACRERGGLSFLTAASTNQSSCHE
jgi:hypothetical protein